MASKTKEQIEQQILNEKARLEHLRKQLKAKEAAEKKFQKRQRDHRLIQIGAIVESYCGEIEDLDAFSNYIQQYSRAIQRTQQQQQSESTDYGV